jgi:hypothetical protein
MIGYRIYNYFIEGEDKLKMKNKIAKIIRIITVPPIMILGLIIILSSLRTDIFQNKAQIIISILFLVIVPILAYPLQPILPKFKDKGREGQRELAFILNIVGYVLVVIIGYFMRVDSNLQFIYNTYLISVILLTIINKVFHIRASGHACSATAPLLFLVYFIGFKSIIHCIIIAAGTIWASLTLKRHTKKDISMGAITCIFAFCCAFILQV